MFRLSLIYISIAFLLCSHAGIAQNEARQWRFGNDAGLDFNTSPPTIVTTSTMLANHTCASVADASGNLLFYTDSDTIWDRNNNVMANGTGLFGNEGTCHNSALIIKKPGSSTIYYVFTSSALGTNPQGLYYSEVDMSLSAGNGSVTIKNTLLVAGANNINCGKLTATMHCNGTDVWVAARDYYLLPNPVNTGTVAVNNSFRAFQVTATGVNPVPVVSTPLTYTIFIAPSTTEDDASMKLSPNGRKLGCPHVGNGGGVELFDFDNVTGFISNPLILESSSLYGCEFSPDGTKFYSSIIVGAPVLDIVQFDLCAGSPTAIVASAYTITTPQGGLTGDLQLAPDGKIYISRYGSSYLDVINSPNAAGAACGYASAAQSVAPKLTSYSLPNFMDSYFQRAPHSLFTYTNIVSGCATASFNCVPGCAAAAGYTLTSVLWDFGNPSSGIANSSTLMNPVHSYGDTGTYMVKLLLYYSCGGATDTVYQPVHITIPCHSVLSTSINCSSPAGSATITAQGTGPYSYTWMPTGQTGSVAAGLNPGTYTITVFDAGNNFSYTIFGILPPIVPLTGTLSSSTHVPCHGASSGTACITNLAGGSGNQSYSWSMNGVSMFTTSCVQNLGAGTWDVVVTDAVTSCTFNQSFVIAEPPPLLLDLSSNTSTPCVGAGIVLTGTASGGTSASGAYHYAWTNGPLTDAYTVSSSVSVTQVYTLSSTDDNTCSISNTIAVTFISSPTLTVSNMSICPQQTATLSVLGASSYTWNGTYTGAVFTDNPAGTTQYTVTGSAMGCTATAIITVSVLPQPTPGITANRSSFCINDTIVLEGSGGVTYVWHGPDISAVPGKILKAKVFSGSSGLFTLTVSDANSCKASATKSIVVFNPPDGTIISGNMQGCAPLCPGLLFKVSPQSSPISSLSWQIDKKEYDSTSVAEIQPCFNVPGNYVIQASLKDINNCANTTTAMVLVYAKPVASFSYSPPHPVENLDEVQFDDQSKDAIAFSWAFGKSDGSESRHPSYLFENAGTYPVALVVSNQWNCKDTLVKLITVENDFAVYLPNTFTPNGDERNDVFLPVMRGVKLFDFRIFNRWGEEIFLSTGAPNGWNGTYKGEPCQEDVYVWKLEVTGTNNQTKKLCGFVTLYR